MRPEEPKSVCAFQEIGAQQESHVRNLIERLLHELGCKFIGRVCYDALDAGRRYGLEVIDPRPAARQAVVGDIGGDDLESRSPQRAHDRAVTGRRFPDAPWKASTFDVYQTR